MLITKFIRLYYNKIIQSIAFYPAIIATGFLLLSWVMLEIDFSPWGKEIKSGLNWLSLKDASTARTIVATVAAAIISLTVFSFSMVMIVLNQAASQMSNRVVTSMIENRFQQMILGFYIGTTVYALFLLSTIREITSGVSVPALSIYLLILLTVVDIFLFIYFLDYVTRTVKYETVIERVKKQTLQTMHTRFEEIKEENVNWDNFSCIEIKTNETGYFQSINRQQLLKITEKHNLRLDFLYAQGTFLIKETTFIKLYCYKQPQEKIIDQVHAAIDFYNGQPIGINADYGFRQLTEIAIKSLSPGINDPGTAVLSLHALTDLFSYRLYHQLPPVLHDEQGEARIYIPVLSFSELFDACMRPIWNYGKNDLYIQQELIFMVNQLQEADMENSYTGIFNKWELTVKNINPV